MCTEDLVCVCVCREQLEPLDRLVPEERTEREGLQAPPATLELVDHLETKEILVWSEDKDRKDPRDPQ